MKTTKKKGDPHHYVRHHDDEYIDEVVFHADVFTLLKIDVVPRYKTSKLSGDEWRTSARVIVSDLSGKVSVGENAGTIKWAAARVACLPHEFPKHSSWASSGKLQLYRKGILVLSRPYSSLAAACSCLGWLLSTAWVAIDTDNLCFQPGCSLPGTTEYRLKKQFDDRGTGRPASTSYSGHCHRKFCARHARRGDGGLEDADRNYIVISGHGPKGAKNSAMDESPAAFGGVGVAMRMLSEPAKLVCGRADGMHRFKKGKGTCQCGGAMLSDVCRMCGCLVCQCP